VAGEVDGRGFFFQRVDVHAILNALRPRLHDPARVLRQVVAVQFQRRRMQPNNHCRDRLETFGTSFGDTSISPRLKSISSASFKTIESEAAADSSSPSKLTSDSTRVFCFDGNAKTSSPGRTVPLATRPANPRKRASGRIPIARESQGLHFLGRIDVDGFKMLQHCRTAVPRCARAPCHQVVAFEPLSGMHCTEKLPAASLVRENSASNFRNVASPKPTRSSCSLPPADGGFRAAKR